MAIYAVIKNQIVDNIIVADTKEVAETITGLSCVEITQEPGQPGPGWSYDGSVFTAPTN